MLNLIEKVNSSPVMSQIFHVQLARERERERRRAAWTDLCYLIQKQKTMARGEADGAAAVDCRWNLCPKLQILPLVFYFINYSLEYSQRNLEFPLVSESRWRYCIKSSYQAWLDEYTLLSKVSRGRNFSWTRQLGSHTILRCDNGPTCNLVDRKKTLIQ